MIYNFSNLCAYHTSHIINQTVTQFFAKSLEIPFDDIVNFKVELNKTFCSYGILRGNEEAIKKSENFIYIDHGFLSSSSRNFENITKINNLSGYFRVIHNDLYFNNSYQNLSHDRFNKLKIDTKDLNLKGEIIVLSEPSDFVLNYFDMKDWTATTIKLIQQYTDRKIIVHNKKSETPLKLLLSKAFAFVSFQSTAGFQAIMEGVPAYFTHNALSNYGDVKNIENQNLNHDILYLAANSQWKLSEFFLDDFKDYIKSLIT